MRRKGLSARQKGLLAVYIGTHGENYEKYLAWAQQTGMPVFTRAYLHLWINRNRPLVQSERALLIHTARRAGVLDRQARQEHLEADILYLDSELKNAPVELALKLIEQKRKLLETLAKERGEWMGKENDDDPRDATTQLLEAMRAAQIARYAPPQIPEVIDVTPEDPGG